MTFGSTLRVAQPAAAVTVNVQSAPSGAKLDAWIDFNSDGSWGGPFERIAQNVTVANGNNTISFAVPSWAEDGTTFARFRLSTSGGLGVRGLASDGEVEDYQLTIRPPSFSTGTFGTQNVIATVLGAHGVFATDVDADGDTDLLSAAFDASRVTLHQNDGSGTFTQGWQSSTVRADGARSVFAEDVDGDGDIDVLAATDGTSHPTQEDDSFVSWFSNTGTTFDASGTTISTSLDKGYGVFAADVDGDGDSDVLSASQDDNRIAWYQNDGSGSFTMNTITTSALGARSVFAADVDSDGDIDVLSASMNDNKIAWYENDGSQNFTANTISTAASGAVSVFAADVDGDGDTDVLSASTSDSSIRWYQNNGSQNFTAHTITSGASGAASVFATDVDGDGDTDVLSASSSASKITWYENNGSQSFTAHTISTAGSGATSVFAADFDGDGDIDVASASPADNVIAWYENTGGNKPPTLDPLTNLTSDEDALQQTVNLAGISAGAGETQPLRVTAASDNTGLIPSPTVTYSSPQATGTATFTPVADASGLARITITVEDGGQDNDLSTTADNVKFDRTFSVTVNAVNDVPTLDALVDVTINQGAPEQTVNVAGIAAGGGESQPLNVTAVSANTGLIPNPSVTYVSPQATGILNFTPVATASGTATITVTVEDGGLDNDLSTSADNAKVDRTFSVAVNAATTAAVTGLVPNGGSANRSGLADLTFQFSEATTVSSAGSLILWNHTTGAPVDVSGATLVNNGTIAVTWNLTGIALPEGNYTATLPQAAAAIAATHSSSFHVFPGDSDGDGTVGFGDFGELATNFNLSGPPYGPGDMDGDGAVGFGDFGVLATNFNRSLAELTLDFGDAPESGTSFPTTLANDGARHVLSAGLLLGATVDAEADGQPDANATGDGGDEDGVTFATLTAGSNSAITVAATVPGAAVLNAWIDFNADGDWDDVGEKIFSDEAVINGTNNLTAAIPAGATAGQVFARFRITTDVGYTYSGLARDGEVEDYRVTIVASSLLGRRVPIGMSDFWVGTVASGAGPADKSSPALSNVKPARTEIVDQAIRQISPAAETIPLDLSSLDAARVDQVFEETTDLLDDGLDRAVLL